MGGGGRAAETSRQTRQLTLTVFVELLTPILWRWKHYWLPYRLSLKGTFTTTQEFHAFNSYGKSSEVKLSWALPIAHRGTLDVPELPQPELFLAKWMNKYQDSRIQFHDMFLSNDGVHSFQNLVRDNSIDFLLLSEAHTQTNRAGQLVDWQAFVWVANALQLLHRVWGLLSSSSPVITCQRISSLHTTHGLMNYIDTKSKCRHLKKIDMKRVLCGRCFSDFIDWRYSHSCWYFRPSFVICCPSNLLSGSTPPPLPVWKSILYSVYTYTVCKGLVEG